MKTKTKAKAAAKRQPKETGAEAVAAKAAGPHRVLTMADYRAMEKVAKSIETACRIRRKYAMAMQGATQCIERNLDRLREIVWNND